jgi:hypothetical protein
MLNPSISKGSLLTALPNLRATVHRAHYRPPRRFCSATCQKRAKRASFRTRSVRFGAVSLENPCPVSYPIGRQTRNESQSGGLPSQLDEATKPEIQESTHRIDLKPPEKGYGRTHMFYRGQHIGHSDSPIFAAARWLLANGMAEPGDRVETYRGETLCMSGKAGGLAKWTVCENAHGNPRSRSAPQPTTPTESAILWKSAEKLYGSWQFRVLGMSIVAGAMLAVAGARSNKLKNESVDKIVEVIKKNLETLEAQLRDDITGDLAGPCWVAKEGM